MSQAPTCEHGQPERGVFCEKCNPDADGSFAAPPCWTAPSDIPPDVAKKILAARDALIVNNTNEAFHQLYSIADPTFASYEPWEILEKQSNDQAQAQRERNA